MNATTLTPDQIVRRTGCFGFELFDDYDNRSGGRGYGTVYSHRDSKVSFEQLLPTGGRHSWAKIIPINIIRRPNSGEFYSIRAFHGNVKQQSRKWKAYYYRLRHWTDCMPMRRIEIIGIYNSGRPKDWKHPFSPYDPRFERVWIDYSHDLIIRVCSRFASPRHVFRQKQNRVSYRMNHQDEFWKCLPGSVGTENAISIIDTSSSMECYGAHTLADALGLFFAEHARGAFHNKFFTFSDTPQFMKVRGDSLAEKLLNIHNANWGGSTNLEAVYRMLLRLAVRTGAGQDEMPSTVVIYSDMDFNASVTNPYANLYDDFREAFEKAGYEVPAVVFHNVSSQQMQTPVLSDTMATALSSGRTTHHMKHRYTSSTTPLLHMLEVLMSERYAPIHA